jgi:mono/diheme cytochrome c family protein
MYKRIPIPTDGSDLSETAVRQRVAVARSIRMLRAMRTATRCAQAPAMAAAALAAALFVTAAPSAAQDATSPAARGEMLFKEQGCWGCHTVGAFGTPIAPDLARIGAKHDRTYLTRWLRDPKEQRPTAHMPALALSDEDAAALAAYLTTLR